MIYLTRSLILSISHDRSRTIRVLGVDAGLAATGYGVIDEKNRTFTAQNWGTIRTSPRIPLPERLATIYRSLKEIVENDKPDEIAVEDGFFGKNVHNALVMGQTRGVAILVAALLNIPVFLYPPREVKLSLTGQGAAGKEQVAFMIRRLLKLGDVKLAADASDALAVALCRCQKRKFERLKAGK